MKTRSRNRIPPFVMLPWPMLNHMAYINLTPTAKGMFPYFLGKVKLPNTDPKYHYVNFTFTFSEASRYGCARRSFFRVIEALMMNGFIDPVSKGVRGAHATPNVFRLSRRWENYGKPEYKTISWSQFGHHQIQKQVQNWPNTVAKSEPVKTERRKYVCQK